MIFGWGAATFIYVTAPTLVQILQRKPLIRTVFNAGLFGIVGTIAGSTLTHLHGSSPGAILAQVVTTAAILYANRKRAPKPTQMTSLTAPTAPTPAQAEIPQAKFTAQRTRGAMLCQLPRYLSLSRPAPVRAGNPLWDVL